MTLQGEELLDALERGEVRAAEPDGAGGWVVHAWVKEAILEIFRESEIVEQGVEVSAGARMFRDKAALPVRRFTAEDGVRVVPGGSAIRRGSYVGAGVVCMPPMYINVGAHVGEGAMVDSHALVGTCAQVGRGVHVSAACQVGGVLEPAGARPVIIEDGAFLGGNTGLYEGVLVGAGAVLASGVVLTATTPLFDLVREETLTGTPEAPLQVPAGAVVVPGVRALETEYARAMGLSASCAIVVKYRDEGTDARTALEEALR